MTLCLALCKGRHTLGAPSDGWHNFDTMIIFLAQGACLTHFRLQARLESATPTCQPPSLRTTTLMVLLARHLLASSHQYVPPHTAIQIAKAISED